MTNKFGGIDLGTTISAICSINEIGETIVETNNESERLTPSVIHFKSDTEILVGSDAKRISSSNPETCFFEFKREMGEGDKCLRQINSLNITPIICSSLVLKKLAIESNIKDVVISVPAYFQEDQRSATKRAGEIAGLNVLGLINEPTAAALYYGTEHSIHGTTLVFDLGGGTFDVTIMNIDNDNIEILNTEGDAHLGGIDFDKSLQDYIVSKYVDIHKEEPYHKRLTKEKLQFDCEDCKKALSKSSSYELIVAGVAGTEYFVINQSDFEELITEKIGGCELIVETALDHINLQPSDIKNVLLVGGSTRIPMISNRIEKLLGKKPIPAGNVDEAVVRGAAIHAAKLLSKKTPERLSKAVVEKVSSVKVKDIVVHSLGTQVIDSDNRNLINEILIKKGTKLPASGFFNAVTCTDNQTQVRCNITQGESTDPDLVDIIYEEFLELPPNRPEGKPIDIKFTFDDKGGVLHAIFNDIESGNTHEIEIHPDSKNDENTKSSVDEFVID